MKKILPLCIGLIISSPAAAEKFDLACSGETRETAPGTGPRKPWSAIYHVDLDHNAYCENDCKTSGEVVASPVWLELGGHISISRTTGRIISVFRDADYQYPASLEAACEKKPYSGTEVVRF